MKKIAIIYTTFLRDELMKKTVGSIASNWSEFTLLVCYQGHPPIISFLLPDTHILELPFDCGLSAARNEGVRWAARHGYEYCLITADSIKFTFKTMKKLALAQEFLKTIDVAGIIGFNLKNRVPWEYKMELAQGRFLLSQTQSEKLCHLEGGDLFVKDCDICRNFFLAKTQALLEVPWDDALKLSEHEDFFWRFKQSPWKVFWTPEISAEYIDEKPAGYLQYRNRMYTEFRKLLSNKYNLSGWVEYK